MKKISQGLNPVDSHQIPTLFCPREPGTSFSWFLNSLPNLIFASLLLLYGVFWFSKIRLFVSFLFLQAVPKGVDFCMQDCFYSHFKGSHAPSSGRKNRLKYHISENQPSDPLLSLLSLFIGLKVFFHHKGDFAFEEIGERTRATCWVILAYNFNRYKKTRRHSQSANLHHRCKQILNTYWSHPAKAQ